MGKKRFETKLCSRRTFGFVGWGGGVRGVYTGSSSLPRLSEEKKAGT